MKIILGMIVDLDIRNNDHKIVGMFGETFLQGGFNDNFPALFEQATNNLSKICQELAENLRKTL